MKLCAHLVDADNVPVAAQQGHEAQDGAGYQRKVDGPGVLRQRAEDNLGGKRTRRMRERSGEDSTRASRGGHRHGPHPPERTAEVPSTVPRMVCGRRNFQNAATSRAGDTTGW